MFLFIMKNASFFLDSLHCDEEKWEEEEDDDDFGKLSEEIDLTNHDDNKNKSSSLFNLPLLEQDLFGKINNYTLFSKQEKQLVETRFNIDLDVSLSISLSLACHEAVRSMLIMALDHSLRHWP